MSGDDAVQSRRKEKGERERERERKRKQRIISLPFSRRINSCNLSDPSLETEIE
jgi:hypothetical protein